MNILFLMKVFEVGGQEVVTLTLAESFTDHGHNVGIACFHKPNPFMTERADNKIKIFTLDGFCCSTENVKRLRSILIENDIDIVINQWGLPYIPAKVLTKAKAGLRVKTIAIYHNSPDSNARIKDVEIALNGMCNPLKRLFLHLKKNAYKLITSLSMRYVYEHSDLYMVLSPSFVKKFKEFTGIRNMDHLIVQTNPVTIDSLDYIYSSARKQKEIIYVGRIDYNQKRVSRVLEIWTMLEQRFSDWQLTIVGDGPERIKLEQQANSLGLKHVQFKGFQKPRPYYERASILVLTSEYEGFPLVLAECMSFGVIPVVYGSYSAVYDIIDDGKNGIVIPFDKSGFHAEHMAERLSVIMSDDKLRNCMAVKARERSKDFSLETIYRQWENVFHQLVKTETT